MNRAYLVFAFLPAALTACAQQSVTLTMHPKSENLPVIEARVNGKGPFLFGVDTCAAGYLHANDSLIKKLGLKPTGTRQASDGTGLNPISLKTYQIASLSVGDITVKNVGITGHRNVRGRHGIPLDGIIGIETFKSRLLTIDYPHRVLRLSKGSLYASDKGVSKLSMPNGVCEIEGKAGGKPVRFHIDSGSPGGILIPPAVLKGLSTEGKPVRVAQARTVANIFDIMETKLKADVSVGDLLVRKPTIQTSEIFRHGNIGYRFLKDYELSIDQKNGFLRLSRGAVVASKPEPKRYGIMITGSSVEDMVIGDVPAGSLAEQAGLRAGDKIVSVNGRAVASISHEELQAAMSGSPLRLGVKRGEKVLEIVLRK